MLSWAGRLLGEPRLDPAIGHEPHQGDADVDGFGDCLMDECQRDVSGTVRLKLYKGNVTVAGRRSPRSLYRTDFATFEADTVYRQRDAEGFINLNALRLKIRSLRDRRS